MSGFLGIDYDSNEIHAVAIEEGSGRPVKFASYDLNLGKGDALDRARRVRDLLPARSHWLDEAILAIGIEDVYSRHLSSVVAHKRVEGALLACLPREVPIYGLRPQTWKSETLAKSNATKDEVRAWAVERFEGLRFWPQGLIDAFAIASATAITYEREALERPRRGAA